MRSVEDATVELEDEEQPDRAELTVTAHQSSPERVVFTEQGNTDGWIATDQTITLTR
jgi:hypothetical protein